MTLTRFYLDTKIRTDLRQDLHLPIFQVAGHDIVGGLNKRNLGMDLYPGQPILQIDVEIRKTDLYKRYDAWANENGEWRLKDLALGDIIRTERAFGCNLRQL